MVALSRCAAVFLLPFSAPSSLATFSLLLGWIAEAPLALHSCWAVLPHSVESLCHGAHWGRHGLLTLTGEGATMTPLRTKMIRDRQLQRLAPKTQKAYVTAVARFAKFYQCPPDRLSPAQIRTYLHHLLVERRLAWRSCNQAAAGLKFFS